MGGDELDSGLIQRRGTFRRLDSRGDTGQHADDIQRNGKHAGCMIYTEVFPTSNYQPSGGMCIEVYKSDEIHSDKFTFEIWLSVTPVQGS